MIDNYIILWENKNKNNNEIIFFLSEYHNNKINNFVQSELKLWDNDEFKVWYILIEERWNFIYKIIVNINKLEAIDENIEEIVVLIWKHIKQINKHFYIDLNIIKNVQTRINFEELMISNLYQYEAYKKNDFKYKLTISDKNRNSEEFNHYFRTIVSTRDLINRPPSENNPKLYLDYIKKLLKNNNQIKIEYIKWKELKNIWLNWIYDVWKWSENEPVFVILKYKWSIKKQFDIWIIWKWISFDSGWYNLKPSQSLEWMKWDMAWSAISLGIIDYMSKISANINIIVWLPIAENSISDKAYKPRDIVKMYNWKTVEINNTDAEWRLLLADWLSYIEKNYNPKILVDIATLTWAQIIALGDKIWLLLWKNNELNKTIQELSMIIKERVREMPYHKPYFKAYESKIADFGNVAVNKYNPWWIQAWLFLWQFVENNKWVHLDIAWPAWIDFKDDELYSYWWTWFWFRILKEFINYIILNNEKQK